MTQQVRLFQQPKNAMQSGRAKTNAWILEYAPQTKRQPEALMGWIASGDTVNQVRLSFDTKEEALAFVQKKGWTVDIEEPQARKLKGRTYLDNFKYVPSKTTR